MFKTSFLLKLGIIRKLLLLMVNKIRVFQPPFRIYNRPEISESKTCVIVLIFLEITSQHVVFPFEVFPYTFKVLYISGNVIFVLDQFVFFYSRNLFLKVFRFRNTTKTKISLATKNCFFLKCLFRM